MFLVIPVSMNPQSSRSALVIPVTDNEGTPPPPGPRSARFALSPMGAWAVVVVACWTVLMWYIRYLHNAREQIYVIPDADSSVYAPMILVTFFAVFFLGFMLEHHVSIILRRRSLFTDGISSSATVTFVGFISYRDRGTRSIVRWTYLADDIECKGVTPRNQLPSVVVGDKFWVLYEKKHPWFVRRWALFDEGGNLRSNDFL